MQVLSLALDAGIYLTHSYWLLAFSSWLKTKQQNVNRKGRNGRKELETKKSRITNFAPVASVAVNLDCLCLVVIDGRIISQERKIFPYES